MALWQNMNATTSPGVAPSVVQYYERSVLPNMMPEMVHHRDAQKRTLPMNNGRTVQFRRITALPPITTPLVEGVTPDGQKMTETAFTATVKTYGGHIEVTDEYNWFLLGNKHKEASETLANQAALSLDTIDANAMNAGLNVQYAGSKTSRDALTADDKVTFADIKKCVRTLRRANAKPFADGFFHGIMHTDVYFDLTSDPMWIDVASYQDKQKVEKYELGTVYKVKFFESTNAKVFKPETYIPGTNATSITIGAASAINEIDRTVEISMNSAVGQNFRALNGQLVKMQYAQNSTSYSAPVCIESVDLVMKQAIGASAPTTGLKFKFRWLPEGMTSSATAVTLMPYGGGADDAPVYSTLIYAQDAYGSVELGGNGRNVRIIINPPGSAGADDPLEQRGTIAWKVNGYCTVILQDDFIVRLESGATA